MPTPQIDAEWLVSHSTGLSRAQLRGRGRAIGSAELDQLDELVRRRSAREPLQLIVGSVGFRYLDIEVRPGVFIPRPETEVLAGEAIARVPDGGVVVEPCTGTGAIACAVATESGASLVVATDVSAEAVSLAVDNARMAGAAVTALQGDLLQPVDPALRGRVDVLVANPPYLTDDDIADGEPEVVDWDPRTALVAGPSGHEVTDRLIGVAARWLRPGGWLLLEVASARAAETARRCIVGGLEESAVVADLTGADRVVVARVRGA